MTLMIKAMHSFIPFLASVFALQLCTTTAYAAQEQQQPATSVSMIEVKKQTIDITETLPARISSPRQAEVRPQVNGIVMKRLFKEGAFVEQGDQLFQIDSATYEASLAMAKAEVKSAEATVKSLKSKVQRYKQLVKTRNVSVQEYDDVVLELDQAVAQVAVAQTQVDIAELNLGYTKVYAPISGQIGRSLITEGALVTASQTQPLALITQLDPVNVDMQKSGFQLYEFRRQLQNNDVAVDIHYGEDYTETYPLQGKLAFFDVNIDQTTGSVALRAEVENPDSVLLPGMYVQAEVHTGKKDVFLVPQRASTRSPDGSVSVWTISNDNTVNPVTIEVGKAYKDQWIVKSGLNEGHKVVVEGTIKLSPGASVKAEPWAPNKKSQQKPAKQ